MENSNPQPKRCNSVVTAAELSAMSDDDAPFPTAISQERIDTIVKNAQALMHAEHRICAVCDEVVLYQPAITDYDVDDLPDSFFSTLCPPDGSVVTCPSLDPMLLEHDVFSTGCSAYGITPLVKGSYRAPNAALPSA